MPLSTHVRRFSLSQWRYYYNQLLFIDAPLTATFIQGLMPLTGSSPTVEIEPITANDHQPSAARDAISKELSSASEALSPEGLRPSELAAVALTLDELTFDELTFNELPLLPIAAPLTPKRLTQTPILNIYSDSLVNRGENSDRNVAVELLPQPTIEVLKPILNITGSRQRPVIEPTEFVTVQSTAVVPPKIEIPPALCKVSELLASFVTR